ncbi:hypothetical protein HPYSS1_05496 [Helicobacter pylori SS1]|nr:hypothetical protein HPYSS1_05496 [Helicobacter pylori SS1]
MVVKFKKVLSVCLMRTEPLFYFEKQGMFKSPCYTQPLWQNSYFGRKHGKN